MYSPRALFTAKAFPTNQPQFPRRNFANPVNEPERRETTKNFPSPFTRYREIARRPVAIQRRSS